MRRTEKERMRSWSFSTIYSCVFTGLVLVQIFSGWPL